MLELKNLTLTVPSESGPMDILKDVSLSIADKKFIVITGPNGGGKTTLAKTIMGLATPTSGRILWNGEDITDLSIADRAKKGISYGFQQPPRFKGMKVSVSRAKLHRSMPASGSSKIIRSASLARTVAISMRLTSPPDREASTSRST